ncbi:hypothetical protein O0L34_g264 [Tuta absoluta]|nr:hypothetical protein O0L34_g264 [Tuta absoluta]
MTTLWTTNSVVQRCKHLRGSKKPKNSQKKHKSVEICRDYEMMRLNDLVREKALQAYLIGKADNKWQNIIVDTAQEETKQKISICKATFNRACNLINNKIYGLLNQIQESDKRAKELNMGFYKKIDTVNDKFYSDLSTMRRESEKRNSGFVKQTQLQKYLNDLGTLKRENNKRNAGFKCGKNDKEDNFKKLCQESRNRDKIYSSRKIFSEMDRMNKMNESRTKSFMAQRPDSKYDAVMSMNERRTAGFTTKKPLTKIEEITRWNDHRNTLFHLRA